MPKDEWGVKRLCGACGARFYDLGRDPVDCPKCGETYVPIAAISGKAKVVKESARAKAAVKNDVEDDEVVVEDVAEADDAEDDIVADAALPDDDDDDDEDDAIADSVLLSDDDDEDDALGDFATDVDGEEKDT